MKPNFPMSWTLSGLMGLLVLLAACPALDSSNSFSSGSSSASSQPLSSSASLDGFVLGAWVGADPYVIPQDPDVARLTRNTVGMLLGRLFRDGSGPSSYVVLVNRDVGSSGNASSSVLPSSIGDDTILTDVFTSRTYTRRSIGDLELGAGVGTLLRVGS